MKIAKTGRIARNHRVAHARDLRQLVIGLPDLVIAVQRATAQLQRFRTAIADCAEYLRTHWAELCPSPRDLDERPSRGR